MNEQVKAEIIRINCLTGDAKTEAITKLQEIKSKNERILAGERKYISSRAVLADKTGEEKTKAENCVVKRESLVDMFAQVLEHIK